MKNIFIVNNVWELFVSLIVIKTKRNEEPIIILNRNVINEAIIRKLRDNFSIIEYNFSENIVTKIIMYYFRKKIYIPFILKNINLKNIKINSFSDQDIITRFFIDRGLKIDLYEHGIINYEKNFNSLIQKLKKIILKMEKPYGRNKCVKKIYLKFPEKAPKDIKEKVRKLELNNWIQRMGKNDKNEILNIFSVKYLNEIYKKKELALLLTQPLEIKRCTIKQKERIYKKIYEEYNQNFDLYIKPHPLEKETDYLFLTSKIIDKNIPIEVLLLIDKAPKLLITLYSSGIFSFKDISEIHFLGTKNFIELKGEKYEKQIFKMDLKDKNEK